MLPALSQVCTLQAPFEQDLEDFAAAHCRAVEIWLGKLEHFLTTHSVADARRLLEQNELAAPVASFQGGLLISQGDARRAHWKHFERRLMLCHELQIPTLVIANDATAPLTEIDLERVRVSLAQAARQAAAAGVRLALEFRADAKLANNLQSAAALVAEIDHPALGLCLDLFHYHCGPSKPEDFGYLTPRNLFHVQVCDLLGVAREFATDADRILPGDGEIPIQPLLAQLQTIGYNGAISLELMNHQIWQVSPRSFGEIAMTSLRKLLGQATME
jgi:sugar phosphate isomerase/epimerase